MEPDPIIGALTRRRVDLGLSQSSIAELLHVRSNTLGLWEAGLTSPALRLLREWARVLGMALWVQAGAEVYADA